MRLLFVTEKFPYPLDTGGNVRTYHLLRGLAGDHAVTLVAADSGEVLQEHIDHVRMYCSSIVLARTPTWTPWRDLRVLVRSIFNDEPVVMARRYRCELAEALRELLSASQASASPEAIYFNHLDAAMYLPLVPAGVGKILDEHNVVANQVASMAAAEESLPRRLVLRRDQARVARHEVRLANQMDICLACSDADADSLRALGVSRPIAVIPNGVDIEYFHPAAGPDSPGDKPAAVFVGTLDYDPCERGVWHFCINILPLIRKKLPEFRLLVVGRNPSERLRRFADRDHGVVLTGRVEDVRPYLARAQVCVVPLLSGSGTRLKILEAMAAGVPVVSTTIGAEGIAAENGRHIWLADQPDEFSSRVLQLLAEPALTLQMRDSARQLVTERYSWSAVHAMLRHHMQMLQGAGTGTG